MKRNLTLLSSLYEEGQIRIFAAWEAVRGNLEDKKLLRKYALELKRCAIIQHMMAVLLCIEKEKEDFDEPLPARTCNLDDELCESCT